MTDVVATIRDDSGSDLPDADAYLGSIGAPAAVVERARRVTALYTRLVGHADFDIFVSDVIDDAGNRNFDSIWLFTEMAVYEAVSTEPGLDQLDGTPLRNSIAHWVFKTREYDFEFATAESRLALEIWFSEQLYGELKGTGPNCTRLSDIFQKYLRTNLRV